MPARIRTPELDQEIAEMYTSGMTREQVAKRLNIGKTTVSVSLHENGIEIRSRTKSVPKELHDQVIGMYNSGIGYVAIAKKLGCQRREVRKVLVQHGVEVAKPTKDRYSIKADAFDDLSSEKACYWLGFIYADGCVSGNSIRVDLNIRDKDHLEKLKAFLETGRPLHIRQNTGWGTSTTNALFTVRNDHLSDRLKELGILPNRPDVTLATSQVPTSMQRHFIRGYLDGDGSIGKNRRRIRFIGQEDILHWIIQVFAENGMESDVSLLESKSTKVKNISFSGGFLAWSIVDFLYKDATVWLERKRDKIKHWPPPQERTRDALGRYA